MANNNGDVPDQQRELTSEIHKALEQCREETVWEAIEQLKDKDIQATINTPKQDKMRAIENAILHSFGPQRFVKAIESSEKQLHQLGKLYQVCKLPADSAPEAIRVFMAEVGVFPFLNRFVPEGRPLLRTVCEALGLPERETPEDMIKSIADEIMLGGSENFLTALKYDTLEKFALDLGVSLPSAPLGHEKLVDMLMVKIFELEPYDAFQKLLHGESDDEGKPPESSKKRKRDGDFKDKPHKKSKGRNKYVCPPLDNIKKGITADQLRDLYNVADLQEYCKQHDIPHLDTGEKPKIWKKQTKKAKKSKRATL